MGVQRLGQPVGNKPVLVDMAGPMGGANNSGLALDQKMAGAPNQPANMPMPVSGLPAGASGAGVNLSGNSPLPFKGVPAGSQLPKQPQFNLPGKAATTGVTAPGQLGQAFPKNSPPV